MKTRTVTVSDRLDWIRMRTALWPESPDDHPAEIDHFFANPKSNLATFVIENDAGSVCGFLEAGTRDYAEGCLTSPVGYIEGWWIEPGFRRQGYGAALVAAAEQWARDLGLTEMASDADLNNDISISAHRSLGYTDVQRVVCFRKSL